MSPTPLASCVVVAFHRPIPLARLVARLEHPAIQVIVVNVEADPAVSEVAGRTAVPLKGNPGYAAAVNLGARAARASVTVFLNDDVEIDASAVLELSARIRSGSADVVLPCVLRADGRREPTIAALPSPANLFKEWFLLPDEAPPGLSAIKGVQKWRDPTTAEPVDAGAAIAVAVQTSWIRRHPLPEEYFLYWEESEWFWRLREAGARVVYDPAVVVRHAGGREDVRPAKSRLLARNAVRCVRQTQGRSAAARAWLVVILWNVRLVLFDGLRRLLGSPPARRRLPARASGLRAALLAWREL